MSSTAQDYPINFPYGATDGVYYGPAAQGKSTYIGPYHRGDDRAMPDGTPVAVNGVQIGLSGHSGAASGPHLHLGRFVSGKDTNPNGGGFSFNDAVVTQIGQDSVDGHFVRVQGDGASWIYLHLSAVTCTVGDRLVAPAPPAPAPAPEQPAGETYTVVKPIPGYMTSSNAANRLSPIADVAPGTYSVFNRFNGMVNVTKAAGAPGAWINPADNTVDAPAKPTNIEYSKLEKPLNLVTNKELTHIWDLGFSDYAHAVALQTLPGAPFIAYGKAQRTDLDRPCYYMDEASFGQADTTGVPAHNQGINTVDLSPAPEPPAPAPAVSVTVAQDPGTVTMSLPVESPAPQPASPAAPPENIQYTSFMNPMPYIVNKALTVQDYANEKSPIDVAAGTPIVIAGTFLSGGYKYYRAKSSVEKGTWYGFPVASLTKQNGALPLEPVDIELEQLEAEADSIRQEMGNLTPHEKVIRRAATAEGFFVRLLKALRIAK